MKNKLLTTLVFAFMAMYAIAQDNPIYINGKYEGEYKDGKKSGLGRATYYDGSMYMGEWKDDKRNGVGRAVYKD
jgi:hypothetical protein